MAQCFSLHIGATAIRAAISDRNGTLAVTDTIYVGDQNNGTLEINGGTTQAWNVQLGNTVYNPMAAHNIYGKPFAKRRILKAYEVVLGGGTPGNWTSGGSCTWSGGTLQAIGALKFAVPATLARAGQRSTRTVLLAPFPAS